MSFYLVSKIAYLAFVVLTLPIWVGIKLWPVIVKTLPYLAIGIVLVVTLGTLVELIRCARNMWLRVQALFQGPIGPSQSPHSEPENTADDPYAILGVGKDVSASELKARYHFLLRTNHPDKLTHLDPVLQTAAKARCQRIIEAYNQVRA